MNLVEIIVRVSGDDAVIRRFNRIRDESRRNSDESSNAWSRLRNMFTGNGGILGSINSLISRIPYIGSSIASLGPASLPTLAAIIAALVAILGYLGSIVPYLLAAGAGVVAFGALAFPVFKKILDGVTAIDNASSKAAKNKAWDAIPKALQPAVKTILDIQQAFDKMSKSLTPLVGRIAETIGQIAQKLLPLIRPLAVESGRAIEGLLRQFDKVASSPGFKAFFNQLTRLSGPAIAAIGQGIGQLATSLAQFIKDLTSPQGILVMRVIFTTMAGAIRVLGVAFQAAGKEATAFTTAILWSMRTSLQIIKATVDGILSTLHGLFDALSKIPGPFQGMMKAAANSLKGWQNSVDNALNGAIGKVNQWSTTLRNAPKIVKIQGDIADLQTKLAIARQNLNDPNLTKTRRARIEGNIDQLKRQIAIARAELDAINGKTVSTYITTYQQTVGTPTGPGGGHPIAAASGGIIGAGMASGGIGPRRSRWALVGEHGREAMELPPGTRVWSNPDTERMLSHGGGGGGPVQIVIEWVGSHAGTSFLDWLGEQVRIRGGDPAMFNRKVAFRS